MRTGATPVDEYLPVPNLQPSAPMGVQEMHSDLEDDEPTPMRRPWKRLSGYQRAIVERRSECGQCGGRGKYNAGYPWRLIDPCPKCKGTGRVNG
jgi:hypothetical protein